MTEGALTTCEACGQRVAFLFDPAAFVPETPHVGAMVSRSCDPNDAACSLACTVALHVWLVTRNL